MSNLVTEVDRAIQFETITKQAHEANLQALKDGKIIGVDDFLKLVEVEPKLRWMNDHMKKWASGTTLTYERWRFANDCTNEVFTKNIKLTFCEWKDYYGNRIILTYNLPNLPFKYKKFVLRGKVEGNSSNPKTLVDVFLIIDLDSKIIQCGSFTRRPLQVMISKFEIVNINNNQVVTQGIRDCIDHCPMGIPELYDTSKPGNTHFTFTGDWVAYE